MTTIYEIPKLWPGETVAVIGNAPRLTAEQVESVAHLPCIAVNRAITMAPHAAMLVAIDGNWPPEADTFPGLRIVGIESELDALYVNLPPEVVDLDENTRIHIRNNALSAIRIAATAGASKILLPG